jgi:hypothetical protein
LTFFTSVVPAAYADEAKGAGDFPQFRVQEIETGLQIGYAVLLVDLNGDGKKDIVVVDKTRVVWYENPNWKRRTIVEGKTQPDNVCIAAHDIALGAGWNPADTTGGGTLQWLKRGKTLDEPWTIYPIDSEPTVHRIRFADLDGSGRPRLIVVPLFGRGSTGQKNHMDAPVRILAYSIPKDPTRDRWHRDVLSENLHVSHNFYPVPSLTDKGMDILTASYEGGGVLFKSAGHWEWKRFSEGNQDNPNGSRGASEVKQGALRGGRPYIATIEPWHGNQVVVYRPPLAPGSAPADSTTANPGEPIGASPPGPTHEGGYTTRQVFEHLQRITEDPAMRDYLQGIIDDLAERDRCDSQ